MHGEGIGLSFLYCDVLVPHADRSLVAARHTQGTGARLYVISICIDCHFHHIMISRTAFPSTGRSLDDRIFQQLYDVALQLRRVFKAVHMVAAADKPCTERMAVTIMDMEQVSAVIKAVNLRPVFIVRKFCAVVTVGKRQTLASRLPGILRDLLHAVRAPCVVGVAQLIAVEILHGGEQLFAVIGVCALFSVRVGDRCQFSVRISKAPYPAVRRGQCLHPRLLSVCIGKILQLCDASGAVSHCGDLSISLSKRHGNLVCILVNDMDQMARLAEYHAAVVFTLNHIRLFARIAVYFQRQLLAKLVLPLFFLTVITEVTSCAIRIDVFIIIRTPDRLFLDRLIVIQAKTITVSHLIGPVICVVYMRNRHRHAASTGRHVIADQDQVSIVIIDMHLTGTARVLAVVTPIVLQAGIVYVGNPDLRAHFFKCIVAVGSKVLGITGKFIGILHHQAIIFPAYVPAFHQVRDIQADILLLIIRIGQLVFDELVVYRAVVPVQGSRGPWLFYAVYFNGMCFLLVLQGYQRKACTRHHIPDLQGRKLKL